MQKILNKEMILLDYQTGMGSYLLARKYGSSPTTIVRILNEAGVVMRMKLKPKISEDALKVFIANQTGVKFKLIKFYVSKRYSLMREWIEGYMQKNDAHKFFGVSAVTFRKSMKTYGLAYPSIPKGTLIKYYKVAYGRD